MTEPIRVALVGCGNIALGFHIPAYLTADDRFRIVGIADPTPERLELGRVAAGLTPEQVHADVAELLARDDVDALDLCTPQHLHRDVAVAAARAGKHVLCEKPIAAVPADAEAMRAAAEKAGTVLAVVANYLFFPEVVALRAIIDSGELGEIRTARVDMLGVLDLPGAAGYRPSWRHDPAQAGGGVLVDMLHGVYLAEALLGARAERVSAFVDSATDGDAVDGIALCRLEAGRRVAMVNIAWGMGQGGVAVEGTRGRAVAHYRADGTMPWAPFESLTVTTESGTRTVDLPAGAELEPLIAASMRDTVLDFAEAIAGDRAPAVDAAVARHILEITVAAYASGALGTTVRLPLDGALFTAGVAGLTEIGVPDDSFVRRRGLFGLTVPATSGIGG
ncbi:Gfo/Idh/MocA family oxidoreductase [Tsukamurella tyrosinosolvens]|uniref:Gfo/Idh/MocA family protein n=1 Tax=Tsukamurella tyrosinosolvens TaxID=57704 RepID=UPI00079C4BE0|nr:Gfo/Idh/MocA family oxidoreductase [Tsukamurella tyrosinosolvens]KXP04655.1 oxidoreductase [Tsukamurella tyrosinosolvens]KZL97908.1 oxidoreductase [Tsukamurella tyrosinosolvens]MCA4995454.1 Gfo/Idh/MocA family oxidoreductase [Tsukamurella tyrosinosolvens]WEL92151.1 Gfo/Idh/MocA family oxidoreductase [Tsukamurella tyrosinosolvens]